MRVVFALVCLVLPFLAAAADPTEVIVLTTDNFEVETKKHDLMLVEFYAPWCGHCKSLAPQYDEASLTLSKNDPPIALGKVDATVETSLGQKFGVNGYPTLKIFRNGVLSGDYGGGRQAADIIAYMKKQVGPSSKELKTVEEAEAFLAHDDVSVIGLFADTDDALSKTFQQTAAAQRELFRFAHSSEIPVMNHLGFRNNVVVFQPKRLHNKFEDAKAIYQGSASSSSDLEKFLFDKASSLVAHVNKDSGARFEKKMNQIGLPVVNVYYKVDYRKDPKGTNYIRNRILKIASEFKKQFLFAIADKEEYKQKVDALNLGHKDIAVSIEHDKKRYGMSPSVDFSPETLKQFLQDYSAGKIKETIKSEPVPTSQGDVRVVVGENFNEEVLDNDDDVLIEFYAPWCGHCKKLEPIFNELGAKVRDEKKLRIAKIDATANEFPQSTFPVSGYPTIFFLPGNNKRTALKYEGDRDVAGFIKYIKEKAYNPLETLSKKKKSKKAKDSADL